MERVTMYPMGSTRSRARVTIAAALFAASVALPARAQSVGTVRARDTLVVRAVGLPIDSIRALMRELDRLEYGTDNWIVVSKRIDSLVNIPLAKQRLLMQRTPIPADALPKGWIGLSAQGPRQEYTDSAGQRVTYFAYPLIVSVEPDSPAGHAGITPGDRLIAYNGIDVINHEFNLTRMLVPESKLDVTVRRDGERKDFSLVVVKTPERLMYRKLQPAGQAGYGMRGFVTPRERGGQPDVVALGRGGAIMRGPMLPGNIFIFSRDGFLGATMSPVTPELAKVLNLAPGVLVNQVPETSPAWTSGLRAGDVVVSVASQPVTTMRELQAIVQAHLDEREVPLKVMRDHKPREITVRW